MNGPIVCFGEVLLRLASAPGARLANTSSLSLHCGGAEANVGAVLAQLGNAVEMATVLPNSPLGDLCQAELRRVGLRADHCIRADGRLGLYFFEPGSGGGGRIVYDREGSAFCANADALDWAAIASGARWFHLSGINLALGGKPAAASVAAVEAMRAAGATVSFDVNHRASLWEGRSAKDVARVRHIVEMTDVLFAGPLDLARILGTDLPNGNAEDRRNAAQSAFAAFAGLRVIASTIRSIDHDRQLLSARIDTRDGAHETDAAVIGTVVDRIGSGDAFAGGLIDGLVRGASPDACARQGLAAAVMKHGISGDRWIGARDDLDSFDPHQPRDIRR